MLNNLLQMHLKLLQTKSIQKIAEETGVLICNKISNKITKVTRKSKQNNLGTVTNEAENIEHDGKIPNERKLLMV